jgi:dUTP pyrophosphatase
MAPLPLITFKRLYPERDQDIPLPTYMTSQAAGMDLRAAIEHEKQLAPGDILLIPTGLAVAIPHGFEAQIRPRSGLAIRHGIGIINSPGTIDADYRGEVKVAVINLGKKVFTLHRGNRIAQMIIQRVYQARITQAENLPPTGRGSGGFGHTGIT